MRSGCAARSVRWMLRGVVPRIALSDLGGVKRDIYARNMAAHRIEKPRRPSYRPRGVAKRCEGALTMLNRIRRWLQQTREPRKQANQPTNPAPVASPVSAPQQPTPRAHRCVGFTTVVTAHGINVRPCSCREQGERSREPLAVGSRVRDEDLQYGVITGYCGPRAVVRSLFGGPPRVVRLEDLQPMEPIDDLLAGCRLRNTGQGWDK